MSSELFLRSGPPAEPIGRRFAIDHPAHYTEGRSIETIEVIEDWDLGYHLGNAVKYISRAGRKGSAVEDLLKACWYLEREIERLRAGRGQ